MLGEVCLKEGRGKKGRLFGLGHGRGAAWPTALPLLFARPVIHPGKFFLDTILLPISNNLRGAIFMSISMIGFTANDTMTKSASAFMNMGQVMLLRGLFATILIVLLAWSQGALRNPRQALHPLVALRSACEALATIAFLIALANIPLATVSAVLQALPLAVTMGAAIAFGEEVRWRRWAAIVVGFTGVLIIVRPGNDGFNAYALWALGSVGFCTVRDLATKRLPERFPRCSCHRDRRAGDGLRRFPGRPDGRLESRVAGNARAAGRPPCCFWSATRVSSWRCVPPKSPMSRPSATRRCCGRSCSATWFSATCPTAR